AQVVRPRPGAVGRVPAALCRRTRPAGRTLAAAGGALAQGDRGLAVWRPRRGAQQRRGAEGVHGTLVAKAQAGLRPPGGAARALPTPVAGIQTPQLLTSRGRSGEADHWDSAARAASRPRSINSRAR